MHKLISKRAEIYNEMKALNDTISARSIKGESANDEKSRYAELETQFTDIDSEIGRQTKFRSFEDSINKAIDSRDNTGVTDENKVRSAFVDYLRSGDATNLRSLNSYSVAEGGALVGQTMFSQIVAALTNDSVIRGIPGVQNIRTTNLAKIPVGNGVVAFGAVAQTGSYGESSVGFDGASLDAYKFGGIVKVSDELLSDSTYDVASYLNGNIASAQAEAEEGLFLNGSGTNTVKGLTAYTDGTDTEINSGSLADDLIDASFATANLRKNGVYVIGTGLAKAARKIKGTDGAYLWQNSLIAGQPNTFNGRPVYVTDAGATVTTAGTIGGVYVDPKSIVIGDRLPLNVLRMNEIYAAQGMVGFRYTFRTDMALLNSAKSLTRLVWA